MMGQPARKGPQKDAPQRSLTWRVVGLGLKGVWTAFVIMTPVLGAWVASSLAAYANGPVALAAASGLLAFPLLPLLWEGWAERGRRKRKVVRPHILTSLDRLVLRTLAVNLLFLGVLVGDRYYLADATWDSGSVSGTTFKKGFRTDYMFTPAEVFGLDHFPNDAKWQLRQTPLSRGDFFRQAMMTPRFYAEGRELLSPQRSQVTVSGAFTAEIKTRPGLFTLATWSAAGDESRTRCTTEDAPTTRVTCELPGKGRYLIKLFSSPRQYSTYDYIGQFEANRE